MASQRRYIAADGTPQYVIWAEQWLVGGALLAPAKDVPVGAVHAEDFHDRTLGMIWAAVAELASQESDPLLPAVALKLNDWGQLDEVGAEPRLSLLATAELAFVYSSRSCLLAHAEIVAEHGAKRRRITELADEVRAITEGRVIPAAHRFKGGVDFVYTEAPLAIDP